MKVSVKHNDEFQVAVRQLAKLEDEKVENRGFCADYLRSLSLNSMAKEIDSMSEDEWEEFVMNELGFDEFDDQESH